MTTLFYIIVIVLLVVWVAGYFSGNTGNVMAIAAVALSKFAGKKSQL